VLARAFGIVDRLNGYNREIHVRGPSPDLPYRLRPGLETSLFGIPVRVNRLGFRGGEMETMPAAGVQRTLLLGDSVVFGLGVREEETVAAALARRLNEIRPGAHEVVNAGAQGYDTVAEAALLEDVGPTLRPAVVVVGMSLNDYDPAPGYDPTGVLTRRPLDARPPSLLERSEFLLLLRWLGAFARGGLYTQILANAEPPTPEGTAALDRLVAAEHQRFYASPDPALWARLGEGLRRVRQSADAVGARLVVAIFPESYQVEGAAPDTRPQQRLLALCGSASGVDLRPAFGQRAGGFFQDAQHPTRGGHARGGGHRRGAAGAPPRARLIGFTSDEAESRAGWPFGGPVHPGGAGEPGTARRAGGRRRARANGGEAGRVAARRQSRVPYVVRRPRSRTVVGGGVDRLLARRGPGAVATVVDRSGAPAARVVDRPAGPLRRAPRSAGSREA
jgi:hypothetical protein